MGKTKLHFGSKTTWLIKSENIKQEKTYGRNQQLDITIYILLHKGHRLDLTRVYEPQMCTSLYE